VKKETAIEVVTYYRFKKYKCIYEMAY